MKVDAHDHKCSRACYCEKVLQKALPNDTCRREAPRGRFRKRILIFVFFFLRATEKALRAYGCGNAVTIRCPSGNLRPSELAASDNRINFRATRAQRSMHGARTNIKRGNSFLAKRETSGGVGANRRLTQTRAKRGPHWSICFEESTTRPD